MIRCPARFLTACTGLIVAACGGAAQTTPAAARPAAPAVTATSTSSLTKADLSALADAFTDQPFQGGQTPPFLSKWVSPSTFMFLQLDKPEVREAQAMTYLGVGVKGVFCSESQPDRSGTPSSSFRVFQQWNAADFATGLGGKAGSEGSWLTYLAVDKLSAPGRTVDVGIDYKMPGGTVPSCGAAAAKPTFAPAGAGKQSADSIAKMFGIFADQPLQGGQVAPRAYKQINEKALAFLQYDRNSAKDATELRYLGIFWKSTFCRSTQPSADFTHFHRLTAPSYAQGHGGPPTTVGWWGTWVAAVEFQSQGRTIPPGVDRQFSPTPPPSIC